MTGSVQQVRQRVAEGDQVECAQPKEDLKLGCGLEHQDLRATVNPLRDCIGDRIREIHDRSCSEAKGVDNLDECRLRRSLSGWWQESSRRSRGFTFAGSASFTHDQRLVT